MRRVWRAPEPRRRSWSGSAGRRTTRASSPRSTPIRTPTRTRCFGGDGALLVALDQVQDPRNLGAVCRSAEVAGAAGLVDPRAPCRSRDRGRPARPRRVRSSTSRSPTSATSPTGWLRRRRPDSGSGAPTPRPIRRPWEVDLQRPDHPRPRRGGEGPAPSRRRRLRRPGRAAAARAGSSRSTSPQPPPHCFSRHGASAVELLPIATAFAKTRFGVDRTPRSRKLARATRVNLSLSLR